MCEWIGYDSPSSKRTLIDNLATVSYKFDEPLLRVVMNMNGRGSHQDTKIIIFIKVNT